MSSTGLASMSAPPTVSVIIATYNRSEVLRYAITSVLAQSFRDFELIVVGDCCTDDSETVVRSFDDTRVSWCNLEQNNGNQFGPNNRGLELARGRYIAFLGHDDLWHHDHLAVLVRAIETHQADLVFALTEEIGPPEMPTRSLLGLCASGSYEWSIWAPPSSWLHRRDLNERVGGWRDYRSIVLPTDVDFLNRVYDGGCRIVPVNELTVFKFTSVLRTNAYVGRGSDEQSQWWARLCEEPDLRYRELIEVLVRLGRQHPDISFRFGLPSQVAPGSMTAAYRARRGLAAVPDRSASEPAIPPLDRSTLRYLNVEEDDIGPARDRIELHSASDMPSDGLFIGLNWHSLERETDGTRWRWFDSKAQIVVTRPSGLRRRIVLELAPGPGLRTRPCRFQVRDMSGVIVAETSVKNPGPVAIELPIVAGADAIFLLGTEDGGRSTRGDPRILNFRVFSFGWRDDPKPFWRRS